MSGAVALVTGASGGLGMASAELLAAAGARVVLTARSSGPLEAAAQRIDQSGGAAAAIPADLASRDSIEQLAERAHIVWGRIDIVLNIGGTVAGIGQPLWQLDPQDWEEAWRTNASAAFHLIRAFVPRMLGQGAGRMLFLTSPAVATPMAGSGGYAASKAAVEQMAQTLALELPGSGVTVNSFNPGPVAGATFERLAPMLYGAAPAWAQPPEQAALLPLWLCSPDTAGLHGEFVQWNHPNTRSALEAFVARYRLVEA